MCLREETDYYEEDIICIVGSCTVYKNRGISGRCRHIAKII